jgi:hypothetical protein
VIGPPTSHPGSARHRTRSRLRAVADSLSEHFASRLVMKGVGLRTVQELMGHKTMAMALRYSHLSPEHQLDAVQRLNAPRNEDQTSPAPRGVSPLAPTSHLPVASTSPPFFRHEVNGWRDCLDRGPRVYPLAEKSGLLRSGTHRGEDRRSAGLESQCG